MGALTRKARSPRLLPARSEGIFCVGLCGGGLLRRRAVFGLRFTSLFGHVAPVVWITVVFRRGGCIFGAWGRHIIPSATHTAPHLVGTDAVALGGRCRRTFLRCVEPSMLRRGCPSRAGQPMRKAHTDGGVPAACFERGITRALAARTGAAVVRGVCRGQRAQRQ